MWGWFVVKAFHMPSISIPLAIGLSSVVSMFRSYSDTKHKDSDLQESFTRAIAYSFFVPLFVLLFGYIIHLFV
jgi:zona occludens toxin (predicted ATPase)